MESLLVSTGVVALAEIGDKTQLLAFILAARFKKPVPIILGIFAATLLNHGLAGALGAWITSAMNPEILRWVLGFSFIGMAIWTLIPDEIEEEETKVAHQLGVFGATFVTFFLAEMGDKTQIIAMTFATQFMVSQVLLGVSIGVIANHGKRLRGIFIDSVVDREGTVILGRQEEIDDHKVKEKKPELFKIAEKQIDYTKDKIKY